MSEDNFLVLFAYFGLVINLIILLSATQPQNRAKVALVNLFLVILYSAVFVMKTPHHGESLAVWFYWLLAIGVHFFINLIELLVKIFSFSESSGA